MSAPNPIANSLLTEHLKYTPLSVIDDIINTVNELIYKSVNYVEQLLQNADPAALGFKTTARPANGVVDADVESEGTYPPEAKLEIEEGIHKLETLFESTIDRDFDKLEIYALRNVFMVPDDVLDWMRLRHYEGLNFNPPPDAPTRESIKLQRHKLLETQKLHASLLRESARNAQLIAQLRSLLSASNSSQGQTQPPTATTEAGESPEAAQQQPTSDNSFAFLTSHPAAIALNVGTASETSTDNPTHRPITDTTSFTLSQLPHLRSLLASVHPSLAMLSATTAATLDSVPDERRLYIETQTKRHLQVTQGLELGIQGEVRDGEWQGSGLRPGESQVRDLEMVVGIVGGRGDAGEGGKGNEMERMDEGE
ncbi:hypothetical protein GP486_003913 [Trichoglossum hirsutum]|uniref:Mis12 domain-containing protein n=1 Tax=Trichoglossum hirsutum TaxID=265104 RepID=A0A9P8RQJ1_9PEZI|nr:hypothetical protein GP486_003913 [Trichoglossum hirsutum]